MTSTRAFDLQQKSIIAARIASFNAAFDFLIANPTKSYTLNTGQSTQSLTRDSMNDYQDLYDRLYNQYVTICARLGESGQLHQFAGW